MSDLLRLSTTELPRTREVEVRVTLRADASMRVVREVIDRDTVAPFAEMLRDQIREQIEPLVAERVRGLLGQVEYEQRESAQFEARAIAAEKLAATLATALDKLTAADR